GPAVEPGVLRLDGPIAAVEIFVHASTITRAHRHHWRKTDIVVAAGSGRVCRCCCCDVVASPVSVAKSPSRWPVSGRLAIVVRILCARPGDSGRRPEQSSLDHIGAVTDTAGGVE